MRGPNAATTSDTQSTSYPAASRSAKLTNNLGDTFELTYERLDTESIVNTVKDDGAGAIATFIGTTRNSFQGEHDSTSPRVWQRLIGTFEQ